MFCLTSLYYLIWYLHDDIPAVLHFGLAVKLLQCTWGNKLCNIFELVFTLCHKCNKYKCLHWKMLNLAGNSYITAGNSYVTRRIQVCHTGYSYITLLCICSAYKLDRVRDPTSPLLSKVNIGAASITCLLRRLHQNINPSVTRKPWRVMSPSTFGIGWHNASGPSCHLGADILVCHPRNHVIYV